MIHLTNDDVVRTLIRKIDDRTSSSLNINPLDSFIRILLKITEGEWSTGYIPPGGRTHSAACRRLSPASCSVAMAAGLCTPQPDTLLNQTNIHTVLSAGSGKVENFRLKTMKTMECKQT